MLVTTHNTARRQEREDSNRHNSQRWELQSRQVNSHWHPVEVCTGPGLRLVAQIMFGFEPGSNYRNQTLHRTFRAFWDQSFFAKIKVTRSFADLMLVTQSGSGNKSHRLDFLWDFRSCPSQK
jgi:hypothetical protein